MGFGIGRPWSESWCSYLPAPRAGYITSEPPLSCEVGDKYLLTGSALGAVIQEDLPFLAVCDFGSVASSLGTCFPWQNEWAAFLSLSSNGSEPPASEPRAHPLGQDRKWF